MTEQAIVKQDQVGRYRQLTRIRSDNFAIITGSRVARHWDEVIKNIESANAQFQGTLTTDVLGSFYKGWVEPLSSMNDDYCGCKASQFAAGNRISIINIRDFLDFSIFTDYIPRMFPGSTNEAFGYNTDVRSVSCVGRHHGHKDFDIQTSNVPVYKLGLDIVARGDNNPFAISLLGWDVARKFKEWYGNVNAARRLAELCAATSDDGTVTPLYMSIVYSPPSPLYTMLSDLLSEDEALFLMLLMTANGNDLSTLNEDIFIPTEYEIELLRDDEFCLRLIRLLYKTRPHARQVGSIKDFRMLLRAAENDIDVTLLQSFMVA